MPKAVSAMPGKKKKRTKKTRIKKTASKAKATRKAKPKPDVPRPPDGKCRCGCGGETGGYFVPGHDARFKGWVSRIAKGEKSDMPTKVKKTLGPWKKKGDGEVPALKYNGTKA